MRNFRRCTIKQRLSFNPKKIAISLPLWKHQKFFLKIPKQAKKTISQLIYTETLQPFEQRNFVKFSFRTFSWIKKKGLPSRQTLHWNEYLRDISSSSGLARIELATRGFGDHRSTSELQPYIYLIIQPISLILCLKHDISSKE